MERRNAAKSLRLRIACDASASTAQASQWNASITIDSDNEVKVTLVDPWVDNQAQECKWYLEQYLRKTPFEAARAHDAETAVRQYGPKLFAQLVEVLEKHLGEHQVSDQKPRQIEIDVIDRSNNLENLTPSIHSIHWELLEDASIWPIPVVVTVRRLIDRVGELTAVTHELTLPKDLGNATLTFRILVVLARDLSYGSDLYEDVNPKLSTQTLLAIKNGLSKVSDKFKIEVEVVRPGTFKALQKHLEQSKETSFHLVHFDVHGRVAASSKTTTKEAFLYFDSGKPSGKLAPVRAALVAKLLADSGIRLVVLNACNSAYAAEGDNSNLASLFVHAGVLNVLALSFTLLESTAIPFLQTFYCALLLRRLRFSQAAREARSALRIKPLRKARLNVLRDLQDWFIPVTYAAKSDFTIHDGVQFDPSDLLEALFKETAQDSYIGREVDTLRLERLLLKSNVVCVAGAPGVGKTTLVHKMAQAWTETGVHGSVVHMDMLAARSSTELATSILDMLELTVNVDTNDPEILSQIKKRAVTQGFRTEPSLLILDGLETRYVDQAGIYMDSALNANEMDDIGDFLYDLTRADTDDGIPVKLLLVTRENNETAWNNYFKRLKGKQNYFVTELELSDAMKLALSLARTAGRDISKFTHQDLGIIERMVSCLQSNPLALNVVLPSLFSTGLRSSLQRIVPNCNPPFPELSSKNHSAIMEMAIFWDHFFPSTKSALKVLSLYWISGPFQVSLLEILLNLGLEVGGKDIVTLMSLGQGRGWWKIEANEHIVDIQPSLTLFLRGKVVEELSGAHADTDETSKPPGRVSSASGSSPDRVITALAPIFGRKTCKFIDWPLDSQLMLRHFFTCLSMTLEHLTFAHLAMSVDLEKLMPKFHAEMQNLFWAASLCSDSTLQIPDDQWPNEAFKNFLTVCVYFLTPTEARLCIDAFQDLISARIERNGGLAFTERSLFHILWALQFINNALRGDICQHEHGVKHFNKLAADIADASCGVSGLPEEELMRLQISVAYRNYATSLLYEGDELQADVYWSKMLAIDDDLFLNKAGTDEQSETANIPLDSSYVQNLNTLFPDLKIDEDRIKLLKCPQRLANQPWVASWYPWRKTVWALLKHRLHASREQQNHEISEDNEHTLWKEMTSQMQLIDQSHMTIGSGFTKDRRWWPANLQIDTVKRSFQPSSDMSLIASGIERGDVQKVVQGYWALANEATGKADFEGALQCLETLLDVYQHDEVLKNDTESLYDAREILQKKAQVVDCVISGSVFIAAGDYAEGLSCLEEASLLVTSFDVQSEILDHFNAAKESLIWHAERQQSGSSVRAINSTWTPSLARKTLVDITERFRGDPVRKQQYFKNMTEFIREMKYVEQARSEHGYDKAIQHLDHMLEIVRRGNISSHIKPEVLETERQCILQAQEWTKLTGEFFTNAEAKNFEQCYSVLEVLDEIDTQPGNQQDSKQDILRKMRMMTEVDQMNHLFKEVSDARAAARWDDAIAFSEQLLNAIESRAFPALALADSEQLHQAQKRVKFGLLYCIAWQSEDMQDWETALGAANSILELTKSEDDVEKVEAAKKFQRHFMLKYHDLEFVKAQNEFRYKKAGEHLDKLFEIAEADMQHTERSGETETVVGLESLQECRRQLLAQVEVIGRFGDVMGRAMITAGRNASGYYDMLRSRGL